MLAGAVAPSEARWITLTVLYTACQRSGVPVHLISDSGGAFISDAFEGVCTRLALDHQTIVSTQGQSYMNLMETHVTIQRRLYDYQVALTRPPREFDEAHQQFLALYNTTAPQGLLKERFVPPIPLPVLEASKGRHSPRRSSRTSSPRPCLCARPIAMAVSPSTARTATLIKGSSRRRCCCGGPARTCARCMTTCS